MPGHLGYDINVIDEPVTSIPPGSQGSQSSTPAPSGGLILPWATGTHYKLGQPVIANGATYLANDAHTSGATFSGDSAHWAPLPVSVDLSAEATHTELAAAIAGLSGRFRGTYASLTNGTVIKANDLVTNPSGALVSRIADGTISGSYNPANWTLLSAGSSGSGLTPTAVKTANYTAASGDLVRVDTTGGAVTVTLPAAAAGATVGVKLVTLGGTNAVTIAAAGSDVFNKAGGPTTLTLSLLNQGVVLAAISGVWVVQADDFALSQLDGRYGSASAVTAATAAASAASTAAAAAQANVAATALGAAFGTELGTPISPHKPTPAMGDEYWSIGPNGHIAAGTGLNSTALAPTITANGTNKSKVTRVKLDNNANAEISYRIEFDYAITVPSGNASIDLALVDPAGTLATGTARQRVATVASPRKAGHFVFDFIPKGNDGASHLDVKLEADTTAPSGTVSISNVSVRVVGAPSRPMLVGLPGAAGDLNLFWQQYRPKTDDWQVSRLKFGPDNEITSYAYTYVDAWAADQVWAFPYPDAAFAAAEASIGLGVNTAGEVSGGVVPSYSLRLNNADQILEVETPTANTFELRGNTHGGETNRGAPTFKIDYGNGFVPYTPAQGLEPCRRFQVTLPTQIKRSADSAGDYFANVDHVFTIFPDGVIRCDRTTTFLKDTRIRSNIEWMTSHQLEGKLGRLGAGQSILKEVDTFPVLATPAAPSLATATSGGVLAAGTYSYRVAALSALGETLASAAATQVTTGSTSTVTITPATVTNAVSYAIYGRTAGSERLLATVTAGQTYVDTGATGPSTKKPATVNTARNGYGAVKNDFKASSKATWGVFYEPRSEWCVGNIYDRDSVLSRSNVKALRIVLGAATGAIQKNYAFARWTNSDVATVTSGTVWTATHWGFVYRPADPDDYHREIATRAASLSALNTLYSSTGDYTAPTPAFAPSQVQNAMELWTPDSAMSDGTAIASAAGALHGMVLAQATSTKRPTKQTVNSQPVWRFDGTDDFLQYIDGSFVQPVWVFITAKFRSAYVSGDTLYDGANGNAMILQRKNSTQIMSYAGNFGPTVTQDVESAFHVYTARFDGASAEIRVDGGTATTGDTGTSTPGGITLGTRASGLNGGAIDVRDLLIVTDSLSSSDRAAIETWLLARKP